MVNRGARNLILLSRSGPCNEIAKLFMEELENQGVRIESPSCDVANRESLYSYLKHCAKTMPQIRGCIQASAVLKVSKC